LAKLAEHKGRPGEAFASTRPGWKRHATLAMIAALGSALSLAAAAVAKRSETERNRNAFERRAGVLASAVAQSFQLTREVVLTLPALFEASNTVEQNEFSTFVRPALARHRSLAALEWAPLVLDADRPEFEAKLRSAGYPSRPCAGWRCCSSPAGASTSRPQSIRERCTSHIVSGWSRTRKACNRLRSTRPVTIPSSH
jgi:hypothetical protein